MRAKTERKGGARNSYRVLIKGLYFSFVSSLLRFSELTSSSIETIETAFALLLGHSMNTVEIGEGSLAT